MVKTYGRINWFRTVPIYCQPYNKKVWITASYAHHYTKYIKNYNCIVQWNPYCIIWNSFKHKLIVATQINNNIYFHFSKWPTICHRQDGSFPPWPWQWRPIWEGSWALVLTWRRRPCSRRMSNTWSTPAGLTRPSSYSVSKISFPSIFE